MYVLTVDQRHSRRGRDEVDDLLARLAASVPPGALVRPFERTAGDEVQAVLRDPTQVVAIALDLVRRGNWSVGIGVGPVNEPLPASTRAGSGPAFERARQAVERAKSHPSHVVVVAGDPAAARAAQTVIDLLGSLVQRRSDAGWEAVDLRATGLTQSEVADRLGVTKQAVSQRLLTATWEPEVAGRELAAQLLAAAELRERVRP
jgi:hypothetical protein